VLIATIVGFGVYFGKDVLKGPAPKDRPGFQNPGRHYVFYALPSPWKTDEGRAKRAGYELVLHRADLGGWVTLRTDVVKDEVVDPREVAEQITAKWKDRIPDFKPADQLGKMKLAGEDAVVVEGEGSLDGKPTRGRSLVLVAGGIKYVMGFEAPVEEWDKLERDFTLARESLEISAGAIAPVKTLGENDVAAFESKKFPYRLSVPSRTWREVPDLQTESRFDDLKLQDKFRLGEVVVQARETKDLPGMRVRYVEAKKRLYENKVREIESAIEKVKIRGREAMRTLLVVSNAGGDFMLFTTFVKGDGLVFQIQCRAPLDKRDVYEPLFAKITDSFEVLDRPPAPPEPEKKDPTIDKQPDVKKIALDAALSKPADEAKKPSMDESKAKSALADEKKADAPKKADEKKPAADAKKDDKKKDEKKPDAKKKKSLDDLD